MQFAEIMFNSDCHAYDQEGGMRTAKRGRLSEH